MKKRIMLAVLTIALASAGITGCGEKKEDGDITEISWYLPGVLEGKDVQEVIDTVNAKLKEKYNLKLKINCIDGGNYNEKLQIMNAGREVYDLAFTANWTNDFFKNVSNGVFYDLTEDLPKYAPTLYEALSEAEKESVTVDGKIYAVPNWQIQAKSTAFIVPADRLKSTGMTLDEINNLDDMTTYLRKIHEADPACNSVSECWSSLMFCYGYNELLEQGLPPIINFNEEGKPTVLNQYETPEFENYVKVRASWVKEGLVKDTYDPKQTNSGGKTDWPFFVHIYKPGIDTQQTLANNYEVLCKPISEAVISSVGINAALTGVSATSKHPQEAIKMLEIINTDKEIYNLLCNGIEGKNYEKISENKIKPIAESGYSKITDWTLGSIANGYLAENDADDLIEQTKEYNESAINLSVNGIQFKVDNIATEMANCRTVVNEQLKMLELGLTEDVDAALAKFRNDLKLSGADTIVSEVQKQIDDGWK